MVDKRSFEEVVVGQRQDRGSSAGLGASSPNAQGSIG